MCAWATDNGLAAYEDGRAAIIDQVLNALLAFAGAALVLAAAPGPSTAVILRRTVLSGRRAGVATVLGDDTGVFLWGIAAALGLSALLVASQVAYDAIRIAGAVVLITMGVRSLWSARHRGREQTIVRSAVTTPWRAYRAGLFTNLANPKAGVFAISFLPQFVPHGMPVLPTLLLLSVLWPLIDATWGLFLVWVAGWARRALRRPAVRRRIEQASGVVLIGIGLRLAAESA